MLTLSVLPCSDGHTCEAENDANWSMTHEHSQDEKDHCSPFCSCACCGITINLNKIEATEKTKITFSNTYYFPYSFHYDFSFLKSVWRPPSYC